MEGGGLHCQMYQQPALKVGVLGLSPRTCLLNREFFAAGAYAPQKLGLGLSQSGRVLVGFFLGFGCLIVGFF